jgi:hypothetical protein
VPDPTPVAPWAVQIHPLTKSHQSNLLAQHAGKFGFVYNLHTRAYSYVSRIPYTSTIAKKNRLDDLLADYAAYLLRVIAGRQCNSLTEEELDFLKKVQMELLWWRGCAGLKDSHLIGLAEDLKQEYCPVERLQRKQYFSYFVDGGIKYENICEMFVLLMGEELKGVRETWDDVVKAHLNNVKYDGDGLEGVEDLYDWEYFKEEWKERDDERIAWGRLWSGEYEDLVIWYGTNEWKGKGVEGVAGFRNAEEYKDVHGIEEPDEAAQTPNPSLEPLLRKRQFNSRRAKGRRRRSNERARAQSKRRQRKQSRWRKRRQGKWRKGRRRMWRRLLTST